MVMLKHPFGRSSGRRVAEVAQLMEWVHYQWWRIDLQGRQERPYSKVAEGMVSFRSKVKAGEVTLGILEKVRG